MKSSRIIEIAVSRSKGIKIQQQKLTKKSLYHKHTLKMIEKNQQKELNMIEKLHRKELDQFKLDVKHDIKMMEKNRDSVRICSAYRTWIDY